LFLPFAYKNLGKFIVAELSSTVCIPACLAGICWAIQNGQRPSFLFISFF